MRRFFFMLVWLLAAVPAAAKPKIYVADGDSLFIGEREIRLSGIDAPEYHQPCYDTDGKEYACGKQARRALAKMVNDRLKCREITRDRYHRSVAVCTLDGVDINRKMVEEGWAAAYDRYSQDYVAAEKQAQKARRGIWAGRFMRPELYRTLYRQP